MLSETGSKAGEPTFTAITTSAPMARATSAGTLLSTPPSLSSSSPSRTGSKTAGMAIEARSARSRGPVPSTTVSARLMSVATQRNGIGRSSKLATPE